LAGDCVGDRVVVGGLEGEGVEVGVGVVGGRELRSWSRCSVIQAVEAPLAELRAELEVSTSPELPSLTCA